jgi:two-component system LytT family response regulator
MPAAIFVTAYNEHAVAAFELAALDYLLKPFENERFRQTLNRAREIVRLRRTDALQERLRTLLKESGVGGRTEPASKASAPRFLQRIAVEMRGQIAVVPVERVDYLEAEGNYVAVHADEETYLINDTLSALEARLDPEQFFRIHRSTIVRLDRVEALLTASGGDYAVRLRGGKRLRLARSRRDEFAGRLGLDA